MAGAEKITIRKNKWEKFDFTTLKEITENSVFICMERNSNIDDIIINSSDGIVLSEKKDDIERDFKFESNIKSLCMKKDIYSFESDIKNYNFWKNIGIKGLIVPLDLVEVFMKNEL